MRTSLYGDGRWLGQADQILSEEYSAVVRVVCLCVWGSYLRRIDFVYPSALDLRVIKKKKFVWGG